MFESIQSSEGAMKMALGQTVLVTHARTLLFVQAHWNICNVIYITDLLLLRGNSIKEMCSRIKNHSIAVADIKFIQTNCVCILFKLLCSDYLGNDYIFFVRAHFLGPQGNIFGRKHWTYILHGNTETSTFFQPIEIIPLFDVTELLHNSYCFSSEYRSISLNHL